MSRNFVFRLGSAKILFNLKFKYYDKKTRSELDKAISNLNTDFENTLNTKQTIENDLKKIDDTLYNFESEIYPSYYDKLFTDYEDDLKKIEEFDKKTEDLRISLKVLDEKIKEQNSFIDELGDFIAKGVEVIDKNQSSNCPLCNYDYDSYIELSNRVLNNNVLDSALSNLLKQRSEIESSIKELDELKDSKKTKLKIKLKKQRDELKKNLGIFDEKLFNIKDKKDKHESDIKKLKERLSKELNDINELSLDGYLQKLTKDLAENEKAISIVNAQIKVNNENKQNVEKEFITNLSST